ncbi:hypothetical protein AAG906_011288 [Vitis piasezkii]
MNSINDLNQFNTTEVLSLQNRKPSPLSSEKKKKCQKQEARGCGLQMDAKQLKKGNEEVFNKEVLQETIHKGKGAYGGADLLRQHHTRSAATYPFLVRPVLSTIGHIMIGYVLLVGFF